jgi:hypothetical protein
MSYARIRSGVDDFLSRLDQLFTLTTAKMPRKDAMMIPSPTREIHAGTRERPNR